jgi:anti-sigma-K factor RskA
MTAEGDSMPGAHKCAGDAAAYVLGALEPQEVEAFRRHMADCIVCRDEVAALQQAVDALPAAAPQFRAPETIRATVIETVREEATQATPSVAPRSRWSKAFPLLNAFPVARPALAAIATALLIAVLTFGALQLGGSGGAQTVRASIGSAELRIDNGHAELIVNHLPPPPSGRIYELWLKRGNRRPTPTRTLFTVTGTGKADVGVPGRLSGATTVMVTPEPAGGSTTPTHAPVIVASVT